MLRPSVQPVVPDVLRTVPRGVRRLTPLTIGVAADCRNIVLMVNPIDPVAPQRPKGRRKQSPSERTSHALDNAWRYATADLRGRPHFVILGTQRGGTSSLFRWLNAHPDVLRPTRKEIHYFDIHYDKGARWYRSQFPLARRGKVTGEASPYMLYHPLAPARAARGLPRTTRLIVLLREPVERTVSDYWFSRRRRRFETESLERAIVARA